MPLPGIKSIGLGFLGATFELLIATDQSDLNLRTYALANGWNGLDALVVTIDSGIVVSSTVTTTPALTVDGLFPGGVTLVNNGFIIGMGGKGGDGRSNLSGLPGLPGGTALDVDVALKVNNNGTIGGGGGGGGAGGGTNNFGFAFLRGGGGGGGQTGRTNSVAGIPRGTAGTFASRGFGGTGDVAGASAGGTGGAGGVWGANGNTGGNPVPFATGPGVGGTAGNAVEGNANITWINTGTRSGPIT